MNTRILGPDLKRSPASSPIHRSKPKSRSSLSVKAPLRVRMGGRSSRSRPRRRRRWALSTEGWNGFAVLHTAAARVGGLDLGFVPGQGGLDALTMAKSGALDVLFLLGADETRGRTGGLCDLPRHAWRSWRRASRRHPAGSRLHGKIRHLCQHGRPRAIGGSRQLSAGRRPRGLGDSPGAFRGART